MTGIPRRRRPRLIRRFWRDQDGASAVEFAIIGSILVILAIGFIEFGRAFFLRNNIAYVADVASRMVLMDATVPDETVRAAAKSKFDGDPNQLTVTFGTETAGGVDFRMVTLTHPLTLMIPFVTTDVMTLTVARRVPI